MTIDFEELEKQVAEAFEDRVNNPTTEEDSIIFTNYKRLGFVQVSPRKRVYIELAVLAGIKIIRIVPAIAKKAYSEMIEGRDDLDDNYRVKVSLALNIPCNTPESYADPLAVKKLLTLVLSAAKQAETFPLYDEKNVVKRKITGEYKKRPRTRCQCGCSKPLASRRLIVHWRGLLFATIRCCKTYVKTTFPESYIRINDELTYIVPGDIGLPERELALERLTEGEIKRRYKEKIIRLEEMKLDENRL